MNTTRYHLELKTFFLSVAAAAISLSITVGMRHYKAQNRVVSALPVAVEDSVPTISLEPETVASQISSDATIKLIMKTTNNKNITKTYIFSTSDGSGGNETVIFRKTLDVKKRMTIPFNAWSPDNKYFFIQEHADQGDTIMVFNASGEPFAGQEKYLDLTDLFKKSGNKNNFSEATGWASENLIVFNTTTQQNEKGSSYWFGVPDKTIIQLGLQF